MKPLVSVLIPTYNQSRYIKQAIESVLAQTYPNIEIIIGDDCSGDNTEQIISTYLYNSKVRYIKHAINKGRVGNYHVLLHEFARGEFVINLDGDDYFIDNTYIEKAAQLAFHNNLVVVFGKNATLIETNHSKKEVFNRYVKLPLVNNGNDIFLAYPKGISISHFSTLYRRKEAINIDYYRKNIISTDLESVLRLIIGKKVGFIDTYVGMWRKHLGNESNTLDISKTMNNIEYIDSAYKFAKKSDQFSESELEKWENLMKTRYFFKHLIKSIISRNKSQFKQLSQEIKQYDAKIYLATVRSFKLKIFLVISYIPFLTRFIFKYAIRQESMAKELLR